MTLTTNTLTNTATTPLTDHLILERGVMADYQLLARYHYRAGRPATVMRLWRLRDTRPTAAQRFSHHKTNSKGQVIGVLIESVPSLQCRQRDLALHDRYQNMANARQRAKRMSDEMRCISRVIIDPRWRGLGLAVRMIRHSLIHAQTIYTEALAVMGRIHPMFERAGMTAYPEHEHADDALLNDRPVYYLYKRDDHAITTR